MYVYVYITHLLVSADEVRDIYIHTCVCVCVCVCIYHTYILLYTPAHQRHTDQYGPAWCAYKYIILLHTCFYMHVNTHTFICTYRIWYTHLLVSATLLSAALHGVRLARSSLSQTYHIFVLTWYSLVHQGNSTIYNVYTPTDTDTDTDTDTCPVASADQAYIFNYAYMFICVCMQHPSSGSDGGYVDVYVSMAYI